MENKPKPLWLRLSRQVQSLRTPVTLGSRFGDWEVTWLGGWTRDRLSYLVMVARIELPVPRPATDNWFITFLSTESTAFRSQIMAKDHDKQSVERKYRKFFPNEA
jgi:hypothetical protein